MLNILPFFMKFNKENLLEKIKEKNIKNIDNINYWVDYIFDDSIYINKVALTSKQEMDNLLKKEDTYNTSKKTIEIYKKIKNSYLSKEEFIKDIKIILDSTLDFSKEIKNESEVSSKISKLLFLIFSSERLISNGFNASTYSFSVVGAYDLILKSFELDDEKSKENMYISFFKGLSLYSRKMLSWSDSLGDKNFISNSTWRFVDYSFGEMIHLPANKNARKTKILEVDLFLEMIREVEEINFFQYKKLFNHIDNVLKKEKQFGCFCFFYFHSLSLAKNDEDKKMIMETLFKSLTENPFNLDRIFEKEKNICFSGKAILSKIWLENSHLISDENKKRKKISNYFLKIENIPDFIIQDEMKNENKPVSTLIRQITNSFLFDEFIEKYFSSFKTKANMNGIEGINDRFFHLFGKNSKIGNYFSINEDIISSQGDKEKAKAYVELLQKIEGNVLKFLIEKENKKISESNNVENVFSETKEIKESFENFEGNENLIKRKNSQRF